MDLRSTSPQPSSFGKLRTSPSPDGEERLLDVARFGSRGQQRMSVLWLKIAALQFIEKETGVRPLLLLDDIFSELDVHNRNIVLELFDQRQVILTSAEHLDVGSLPGTTIEL